MLTLYNPMFTCLFLSLSLSLSLSVSLSLCLSLSVSLCVCLSLCITMYVSVCESMSVRVKGRSTFPKCTEKRVCTYKHSTHRLYDDILTWRKTGKAETRRSDSPWHPVYVMLKHTLSIQTAVTPSLRDVETLFTVWLSRLFYNPV